MENLHIENKEISCSPYKIMSLDKFMDLKQIDWLPELLPYFHSRLCQFVIRRLFLEMVLKGDADKILLAVIVPHAKTDELKQEASRKEMIVGVLGWRQVGRHGQWSEVSLLCVLPLCGGQGIAKSLMQFFLVNVHSLYTFVHDVSNIEGFYERFGFHSPSEKERENLRVMFNQESSLLFDDSLIAFSLKQEEGKQGGRSDIIQELNAKRKTLENAQRVLGMLDRALYSGELLLKENVNIRLK